MRGLFRALLIASFVMNAMGTYAFAAEPTKTTIAMSPSGATAATATITFTASVGMVNGGAAVTAGDVVFFIDGAAQPPVALSGSGTASVSTTGRALGPGLHTIRADYQGVADPGGFSPSTNSLTILLTSPIGLGGLPLPQGIVGQPYSAQLSGTGGVAPYTFQVSSGAFPAGLNLSTAGLISGTPTNAFNYNFGVVVTDSTGLRSGEKVVNLKVVNALPSVSTGQIVVIEGNAATNGIGLDLVLSSAATQQITVSYATRDGTAVAGSDYVAYSGTITFLVGDTHRLVPLTVMGDLVPELKEDFFLDLTGATNATIATPSGRVVIEDDDQVSFTLTVTKSGTGSGTVSSTPGGIFCGATCSASFAGGSFVTLTAAPDPSSLFAGWSGACTGTGPCSVAMDASKSVSATFISNTYVLSVSRAGSGSGTVTSTPAGIDCGATCSASYASGAVVTLTATPDATSSFAGWSGACTGTGACTLTLTTDRSVTATFVRNTYALTVTRTGPGTVTSSPAGIYCGASCSSTFTAGTSVTLTATPDSGASFTGWSGACTGTGPCVVTMDGAKSVGASFVADSFKLGVAVTGTGGGTVTSTPAGIDCGATCAATYAAGSVVSLTATPDATSSFVGWSGACTGTGSCVVSMTSDKAVTATFVNNTYTLSVSRVGSGDGTVGSAPAGIDCGRLCAAGFSAGTVVTLTATPDATSSFAGWSGACTGTGACTLTLTTDRSVTATFVRNTYALTVTRTGPGTVTSSPAGIYCGASCSSTFTAGTSVTLTATPDSGASFTGWSGACTGTGPCVVTMDAAKSVTATFEAAPRTLTVATAGTGGGVVSSTPAGIDCGATCSTTFASGSVVTLTATPDAHSTFTGWSGACTGTGSCVLTMTSDRAVTATFTARSYTLDVWVNGGGTVTISPSGIFCGASCSASFTYGTVVTLSATPDPTIVFGQFLGDCYSASPATTCTLTIDGDKSVRAYFQTPVTVNVAGSGTGTITSYPSYYFNCTSSASCGTVNIDPGRGSIELYATADPGSHFAGWTGACVGTGTCVVGLTAAATVNATFVAEPLPTVYLDKDGPAEPEGSSGTYGNALTFAIRLSAAYSRDVTVGYATSPGTAADPADYRGGSGTITIPAGQVVYGLSVGMFGDTSYESDETFTLTISSPLNATLGNAVSVGTILNDDKTPSLTIADASATEGDSGPAPLVFTVTLSAPAGVDVTVDYGTVAGTAAGGTDFIGASGTLTFLPGETTKTITVAAIGDVLYEANETLFVDLIRPTNASIGAARGTGTIVDDDKGNTPVASITDKGVTQYEGNVGTTSFDFTVSLSTAAGVPVTVDFATTDGTASSGPDYAAASGTLVFAPGETSKVITVLVNGELLFERDETFFVDLTGTTNASLGNARALGTILNDDDRPVFSIEKATSGREGNTGTSPLIFRATLSAPSGVDVEFDYATADGTSADPELNAHEPADYMAVSRHASLGAGNTWIDLYAYANGDLLYERDESFTLTISNVVGAVLGNAVATGTILNDDEQPVVSVLKPAAVTEGDAPSTTPMTFTVSLNAVSGLPVRVEYASITDTAREGLDFTGSGVITIPAGAASASADVTVIGDGTDEYDETFFFRLVNALNASIGTGQQTGTILDDDDEPTVSIASRTDVTEGDSGTTAANAEVTLSAASEKIVTVRFTTVSWSATDLLDFIPISGMVTFLPGETLKTASVAVVGDVTYESDEYFDIDLIAATNARIGRSSGRVYILNDDAQPTISFSDARVVEGNSGYTDMEFTATLSNPSDQTVTAYYSMTDITTDASDTPGGGGFVTIRPGDLTARFTATWATGDTTYERDETLAIDITAVSNATIGRGRAIGTIVNDDRVPEVSALGSRILERTGGTSYDTLTIHLSGTSYEDITVALAARNGTATSADYALTDRVVVIPAGSDHATTFVEIVTDAMDEDDETFSVQLSVTSGTATVAVDPTWVILDDDDPPTITVTGVTVDPEGDTGTKNARIEVTLSAPSGKRVTVWYTTRDGTASSLSDYVARTDGLYFDGGAVNGWFNIEIVGDTAREADETFTVELTSATNGVLANTTATVTIVDDDGPTYGFGGFMSPVESGRTYKLGSTIPIKFQLTNAAGELVSNATALIFAYKVADAVPDTQPTETDLIPDGQDTFRWADDHYQYNLGTKLFSEAGLYVIFVDLDDGSTYRTTVYLKK